MTSTHTSATPPIHTIRSMPGWASDAGGEPMSQSAAIVMTK